MTHEEVKLKEEQAKRLKNISSAMRYTGYKEQADKLHERAEIYVFGNDIDEELKKILVRNIWEDNIGGNSDLGYQICGSACSLIDDMTLEEIENGDSFDEKIQETESASIYTSDRLGYLNNNNQGEISDKMKEYDSDIQTACAVWYDEMARNVALELRNYILQD